MFIFKTNVACDDITIKAVVTIQRGKSFGFSFFLLFLCFICSYSYILMFLIIFC